MEMQIRLQKRKGGHIKAMEIQKGKHVKGKNKHIYKEMDKGIKTKKRQFFLARIFLILTFTQYRSRE